MVKVKINGEEAEITEAVSIDELLKIQKVKMPDMVTVEHNGDILDRDQFAVVRIQEGDEIEFLYYMGGGDKLKDFRRSNALLGLYETSRC